MPRVATQNTTGGEIAGRIAIGIGSGASSATVRESRPQPTAASLSAQLRTRTAGLHGHAEIVLGLPGSIRTLDDYRVCLCRFLALYAPLERSLATFSEWHRRNVALPSPSHSARLTGDLATLGDFAPLGDLAALGRNPAVLPHLPTFAHALGALYVLEGSTLGGRLILRDVETRIGLQITGATQFFGGRGAAVTPMWQSFKAAVDAFGREQPHLGNDVVLGAESVFRGILTWFTDWRGIAGGRS